MGNLPPHWPSVNCCTACLLQLPNFSSRVGLGSSQHLPEHKLEDSAKSPRSSVCSLSFTQVSKSCYSKQPLLLTSSKPFSPPIIYLLTLPACTASAQSSRREKASSHIDRNCLPPPQQVFVGALRSAEQTHLLSCSSATCTSQQQWAGSPQASSQGRVIAHIDFRCY